jgi:polyisoprenoid-binding protein YceI
MPVAPHPASPPPSRSRLRGGLLLARALGLAQGAPARAANQSYALDPVHTRVAFQVSHAGFSNPLGSFSGASGRLEFDPEDWASAQLDVRLPIATLNLGDAKWQQKILDRTFFDAGKFPDAHFVSRKVESTGGQTARVTGDLTLHGVTAPLTLQVTFNALKRHPLTRKKTVGFSATGTLSRKAFGIDAWQHLVGDEVRLIIELEATRTRDDAPDPTEPPDAAA